MRSAHSRPQPPATAGGASLTLMRIPCLSRGRRRLAYVEALLMQKPSRRSPCHRHRSLAALRRNPPRMRLRLRHCYVYSQHPMGYVKKRVCVCAHKLACVCVCVSKWTSRRRRLAWLVNAQCLGRAKALGCSTAAGGARRTDRGGLGRRSGHGRGLGVFIVRAAHTDSVART
jgi:hypothetical protein